MPIAQYLRAVRQVHAGEPTEHSYRAAIVDLLQALGSGAVATNEPKQRRDCGAPDIKVATGPDRADPTIGYVECKDIDVSLDEAAKSEQLTRYRDNLPNLLLTDYLEFRWFVEGTERARARIGHVDSRGKIASDSAGIQAAEQLLCDFLSAAPEPVASPEELARHMARLTRMIRDIIVRAFERDEVSENTAGLLDAFRKTLLPQIQPDEFADMFAQTLAYGLFAARVNHSDAQGPFHHRTAAYDIPPTNPFLRRLFDSIAGVELDREPFVGFVEDLSRLLANAEMGEILADFGARTRREDPIVHFYETFLAAYDPKLREMRGVYYTPEPVVSYIVRSVDWILREHFGLPEGLADQSTVEYEAHLPGGGTETRTSPRVLILDPACGTGTFLYHVIDHIRGKFIESNNAGMWPGFVARHLLPRLFGFELLMAPYAVAHLKLGMQLAALDMTPAEREKWACQIPEDQRLSVYLTNTLEEAEQVAQMQFGIMQAIAEEANAASGVKRDLPIMVVLGNPPYSGISANRDTWVDALMDGTANDKGHTGSYYEVNGEPIGERKLWLRDDYVKFIRFAQWRIEQTGEGVLAFITNHGYLDNPTFRGMRDSLMRSFSEIYVLDLHGNTLKREVCPDGSEDANVFDIRQGVAIGIFVKRPNQDGPAAVHHAQLWGSRAHKYQSLLASTLHDTEWELIHPEPPFVLFVPTDRSLVGEYHVHPSISDVMPLHGVGIVTARDRLTTDPEEEQLWSRVMDFAALAPEAARRKYDLGSDLRDWRVDDAQADVRESGPARENIYPIAYRPFDIRWIYYTGRSRGFIGQPCYSTQRHMLYKHNLALMTGRRVETSGGFQHVFCVASMAQHHAVSIKEVNYLFPLYLYPDPTTLGEGEELDSPWPPGKDGRRPNLSKQFTDQVAAKLGMEFVPDGRGDLQHSFGPEDLFDYIYAVFHCPTYRQRYAEFLKIDFPRVPLTSDPDLFRDLVDLGGQLVSLHLMEPGAPVPPMTNYPVPGDNLVERGHPKYFAPGQTPPGEAGPLQRGRVYVNRTRRKAGGAPAQYFEGIPPQVWEFQVGGYQVLAKWLKDRVGRALTQDDLEHYRRIVAALARTMDLMAQIDRRIPDWPIQ